MSKFSKTIICGFSREELINYYNDNEVNSPIKNRISFYSADNAIQQMHNTNFTAVKIIGDDNIGWSNPAKFEITFHDEISFTEFMLLV